MRAWVIAAMAGLVLVSGCASEKQLRAKDPIYFGTTNKSPQDYAACVSESWKQQGVHVEVKPIPNGVDIVVAGRFNVEQVLRAQTYRNATQVNMYTRTDYDYQGLMQSANLCAD